MVLAKLVISNFRVRRMRSALTAAAIALSVSLVVAVTTGYASAEAAALKYLNHYLGSTDAVISHPTLVGVEGPVPQKLVTELQNDPDVRRVTGRLEVPTNLYDKNGHMPEKLMFHLIGLQRPQDTRVDNLNLEAGQWFDASTGDVALPDQVAAESLKVKLGDTFWMLNADGSKHPLKVVGIVHKPEILARSSQSIYVPLDTLQRAQGVPADNPQVTRIAVDLKSNIDYAGWAAKWRQKLAGISPEIKLRMMKENRSELDTNLRAIHILSYLGGAVTMLAATFIVFSTLAMGVTERQRTLAMLRAVGATRGQVARLVIIEGLLISLFGVIIGVPAGVLWIHIVRWKFDDVFTAGVVMSWGGVLFASAGSVFTALLASALPAWTASRVSPLEAMVPRSADVAHRAPVGWALAGLVLISIDPLLFFGPMPWLLGKLGFNDPQAVAALVRFYGHFCVGLPGVMIGFLLLAPMFVWVVDRFLGPAAAWLLGLPPKLLRQQLSSGIWRAAGTAAALMVGLAVLVAMTTQGNSMISGWRLPDKFPDIFLVSLKFNVLHPEDAGLSDADVKNLENVPGIAHFPDGTAEIMPVAVEAIGLGHNPLALVGDLFAPNATNVMFFGVPPDIAFKLVGLDWRDDDGNTISPDQQKFFSDRAEKLLKEGRYVVITDEYRRLQKLKFGSKISLMTRHGKEEYTVAGIVWSPGLDVIIGMFDMGRQFDQRTAGLVFGSLDDARRDFGVDRVSLFAANLAGGVDKEAVMDQVRQKVGEFNFKAGDVRQIKYRIEEGFHRLLLLLSTVAFAALAVASLGVTNTVMASIRTRRWQFGVLRSIGVTRQDLLRLVLAEAVLLGAVGIALGLSAGVLLSIDARQLGAAILGYNPPMNIPWGYVLVGSIAVMAVALSASLWPAIHVARAQPLDLLQSGRAAA